MRNGLFLANLMAARMPMTRSSLRFFLSFLFPSPLFSSSSSFHQSVYQPFSCPTLELQIATRTFEIWLQPDRPREPRTLRCPLGMKPSLYYHGVARCPPRPRTVLYTRIKLLYVPPSSYTRLVPFYISLDRLFRVVTRNLFYRLAF